MEECFSYTVFEHEWLRIDRKNYSGQLLSPDCYKALCNYFGEKGSDYFSLIHNGVKFRHYVGVLQIGRYSIEILPKADRKLSGDDHGHWQKVLLYMLQNSGVFPVKAPTTSNLSLQKNSILDLYIRLFLNGVQQILQRGLIKKYRKTEGNLSSLKGRLMFHKQLQVNLIHKERFYTSYSVYDCENKINQILYKTLGLIARLYSGRLSNEAKILQLSFPDLEDLQVTENTFNHIKIDRKNEYYAESLAIAKLLLLNYHPDVSKGRNHVLALMFNMNYLWQQYVLHQLKKASQAMGDVFITGQDRESFWMGRDIKPDIVIRFANKSVVIDTKWKILEKDVEPSIEDIRQMYAYNHHFKCNQSLLLYPEVFGRSSFTSDFNLPNFHVSGLGESHSCGILFANVVNAEKMIIHDFGEKILNNLI